MPGRPPKSDAERRRDGPALRVYLSQPERAAIAAAAEAAGMSESAWVREVALGAAANDAIGPRVRPSAALMGLPVVLDPMLPDHVIELRGPTERVRLDLTTGEIERTRQE